MKKAPTWEEAVSSMSVVGKDYRNGHECVSTGGKSNRFFRIEKIDYKAMKAYLTEFGAIIGNKIGRVEGENVYEADPCFSMPIGSCEFPMELDLKEDRMKIVISRKEYIPMMTLDELEKAARNELTEENDVHHVLRCHRIKFDKSYVRALSREEESTIRHKNEEFSRSAIEDAIAETSFEEDVFNDALEKLRETTAKKAAEKAAAEKNDFWSTGNQGNLKRGVRWVRQ